jgi:hypothetical protein
MLSRQAEQVGNQGRPEPIFVSDLAAESRLGNEATQGTHPRAADLALQVAQTSPRGIHRPLGGPVSSRAPVASLLPRVEGGNDLVGAGAGRRVTGSRSRLG